MVSQNNLLASQKLQNYLENTIPNDQESCENQVHHQQQQHSRKKSTNYDHNNYYQNSIGDSPTNAKPNCDMCFGENAKNARNQPQILRQAFSSLSDTLMNKENAQQTQQFMFQGGSPDIVKLSQKIDDIYQSLCACIQNHCVSKDELNQLQQQLDCKFNKEDLDVLLLQKANKQSVANALQRKANKSDFTQLEQKINEMGQIQNYDQKFEEVQQMLERQKESYVDLLHSELIIAKNETEGSLKKSLGKELNKINNEIQSIQESFKKYMQQVMESHESIEKRSEDSFKNLQLKVEYLQDIFKQENLSYKKLSFEQNQEYRMEFEKSTKAQINELADVLAVHQKELTKMKESDSGLKEFMKSRLDETERVVRLNMDQLQQEMLKLSKETYYEFDQIDSKFLINLMLYIGELQKVKYQLNQGGQNAQNYSQTELEGLRMDLREIQLKLERLNDDVAQKSNIKDVCALVDLKANVEDVDKHIVQIYSEIEQNCSQKLQIDKILNDQKFINESLCALNCIGKWVWHGGFTIGGAISKSPYSSTKHSFKMSAFERVSISDGVGLNGGVDYVKWSREIINTCPDNFELSKYEDDSAALVVYTSGIYEIVFTFFVPPESHKPSVQLRLNNKPVLSTIDTTQQELSIQSNIGR